MDRYAHEKMHILAQETITYTLAVPADTVFQLARMTPMLAGIDVERLDLTGVRAITIDETMYVGTL